VIAASIAGAISGGIGGLAYVFLGRSALHVVVGVVLGAVVHKLLDRAGDWYRVRGLGLRSSAWGRFA
jgi:hypothetical protein